jgi:chromosome segregation ATPase
MAPPASAIEDFKPLHLRTLGDMNAERSELITEIKTARLRVSGLEQEYARLKGLIDAVPAARNSLAARLRQIETRKPAIHASARPPVPAADSKREAMLAKLAASKDNAERYRLAKEINALPCPGSW